VPRTARCCARAITERRGIGRSMKEHFREHYPHTPEELSELWKNAIFVFDTNTLLNMYRYNRTTFKQYIEVLKELASKDRVFMPNQVGIEFFRNRMGVIRQYKKSYDDLIKTIDSFKGQLSSKYRHHPFVDVSKLREDVEASLKTIEAEIKKKQDKHPDWIQTDEVLEAITKIFSKCTGEAYTESELEAIYAEGARRYEKEVPPGFKDMNKEGERQYGDLIVWMQMIAFAKNKQKPLIFVTGDEKEDWWLLNEGKRIMPLPQLRREMRLEAGVDFHAYTADNFLEEYNKGRDGGGKIDSEAIDEVRRLREIQDIMGGEEELAPKADRFIFGEDIDERYELFTVSIVRAIEIIEYIREGLPNIPIEYHERLDSIDRSLRNLSRTARARSKVGNFYMRKFILSLRLLGDVLGNIINNEEIDDINQRRITGYKIEVDRLYYLIQKSHMAL